MNRPHQTEPAGRPHGALHAAATTALRFEASAVAISGALRSAVGCVVTLTIGLAVAGDAGAAAATVGAVLAAIPSLSATIRRPIMAMAATTCGLALSTLVGSVTAATAWVHLLVLACWAFAGGMLVALGDTGSIVGTQATMAFVVFGRFAAPFSGACKLAGYVAVGGAFQILLTAAARWPIALMAQRKAVADAYRRLSELALGGIDHPGTAAGAALDDAQAALDSPALVRRPDMSALRSLVDEGRRARIELASLQGLRSQLRRVTNEAGALGPAVEVALASAAHVLGDIAESLGGIGVVAIAPLDAALGEVRVAAAADVERAADRTPGTGSAVSARSSLALALSDHVAALAGQLRAAATIAMDFSIAPAKRGENRLRSRRSRGPAARIASQAAMLRANLSMGSTACRHAIRLAVVVTLAELLADHTSLQRGYWVPLTAALVLRPDFGSTLTRGVARVIGTIVGVGITGLIVAGGHLSGAPAVVIIGVLAFGGFASFRASYAAFSAFFTGLVVLLVNLATPEARSTLATAGDRLADTAIGGGLALAVYLLWPTWTGDEALESLANAIAAARLYLDAVLGSISGRAPLSEAQARDLARRLRLARSNSEAVIARSLAEPRARRVDGDLTVGLLAGLRRLSLTTHVLRTTLVGSPAPEPVPAILPLREALRESLGDIVEALTRGSRAVLPPLRRVHTRLAADLAGSHGVDLLLLETDELVDAVDTLGALLDAATEEQSDERSRPA